MASRKSVAALIFEEMLLETQRDPERGYIDGQHVVAGTGVKYWFKKFELDYPEDPSVIRLKKKKFKDGVPSLQFLNKFLYPIYKAVLSRTDIRLKDRRAPRKGKKEHQGVRHDYIHSIFPHFTHCFVCAQFCCVARDVPVFLYLAFADKQGWISHSDYISVQDQGLKKLVSLFSRFFIAACALSHIAIHIMQLRVDDEHLEVPDYQHLKEEVHQ